MFHWFAVTVVQTHLHFRYPYGLAYGSWVMVALHFPLLPLLYGLMASLYRRGYAFP